MMRPCEMQFCPTYFILHFIQIIRRELFWCKVPTLKQSYPALLPCLQQTLEKGTVGVCNYCLSITHFQHEHSPLS